MLFQCGKPLGLAPQIELLLLLANSCYQSRLGDRNSTVECSTRERSPLSERRFGRGLMIAAHISELSIAARLERESILRLPQITLAPLQDQVLVGFQQSVRAFLLHL